MAAVSNLAARRRRKKEARRAARAAVSLNADSSAASQVSEITAADSMGHAQQEAGGPSQSAQEEGNRETAGLEDEETDGSEEEGSEDEEGSESGSESSAVGDSGVSVVTADFAMQNVALQMGLHLLSPDGRRINRISRWVLRCSACFKVTKVRQPTTTHGIWLIGEEKAFKSA